MNADLRIEGLDVTEGIKNCGSEALFLRLLGDFYKLIDEKTRKIEEYLIKEQLRDYTIEVHGLKNTARMIGALELSDLFYQMEKLGNANELEQIKQKNPVVMELFKSYKSVLEPFSEKIAAEKEVTIDEIKKALKQLRDAVDAFDLDEADEVMKLLLSYEVPQRMQKDIERLSVFVTDVKMEEVLSLTEELLKDTSYSHIMLVDDDAISSKAVMAMLQREYYVTWEQSGKAALKYLTENIPDLILLDVHMPGMDGHGLLQTLKNQSEYADIPVIFLTSDEDEQTEILGFSEGAIDFIRKPFRKNVAMQRIKRVLELSYLQKYLKQEVEKQTAVAIERQKKVERMALQMVQALANTIDAKDAYTNGHSTRVAKYSVMLARRIGYTDEKLERLYYAALLHDIGKIGIPKEIINKPSRLTEEEYQLIQSHPGIGANILKEITEIPDIAIGAHWHHERYDGKGYPDRLYGRQIPELARIIGVADAYDAMTSKRSYRDVLPQEVVAAEIEKCKGNQFDPEIADVMLELMREDKEYTMHE